MDMSKSFGIVSTVFSIMYGLLSLSQGKASEFLILVGGIVFCFVIAGLFQVNAHKSPSHDFECNYPSQDMVGMFETEVATYLYLNKKSVAYAIWDLATGMGLPVNSYRVDLIVATM